MRSSVERSTVERSTVERSINPKRVPANLPPASGSYDDAHPHLEHVEDKEATN
jgi:hypothetical protein